MKISELIEELNEALHNHGDLDIRAGSDYGDYTHSHMAGNVTESTICDVVDNGTFDVVVSEDNHDNEDVKDTVFLISSYNR